MKDRRCFICKYQQLETLKVKDDLLFDVKGNSVAIPLCYNHSVELFKCGQANFLTKHKNIFVGHYGIEEDIDIMNFFPGQKSSWF